MPEPTVTDVEAYTQGRLLASDARTATLLAASLSAARRYCRWHVTPQRSDTFTLDGPGNRVVVLPTLNLVSLVSLTEDAVTVDLTTVQWSTLGLVTKSPDSVWLSPLWTSNFQGVVAQVTHGFDNAPDFNLGVLQAVDRVSYGAGGREVIGPFQFPVLPTAMGSVFAEAERAALDQYRLEPQL